MRKQENSPSFMHSPLCLTRLNYFLTMSLPQVPAPPQRAPLSSRRNHTQNLSIYYSPIDIPTTNPTPHLAIPKHAKKRLKPLIAMRENQLSSKEVRSKNSWKQNGVIPSESTNTRHVWKQSLPLLSSQKQKTVRPIFEKPTRDINDIIGWETTGFI